MWQGSEDAIEGLPYIKGSMYIQVLARLLISSSQKYNQGGRWMAFLVASVDLTQP